MFKNLCKKMFPRSLWVYHANSGGCNGCDIEVLNVLTPYYDAERFGIKLVVLPVMPMSCSVRDRLPALPPRR